MGGVRFEIDAPPEVQGPAAEHRRFLNEASDSQAALLEIRCRVERVSATRALDDPRAVWSADGGALLARGLEAELRRVAPGRFEADVRLQDLEYGVSHAMTALSAMAVQREGGLVLHAAAVEHAGRAVLLIGPSGAGKTTAGNLCHGARWIARDRLAVLPRGDAWLAWGMPGGDELELAPAPPKPYPVLALWRVRRNDTSAQLTPLTGARAVALVREATQLTGGVGAERDALTHAIALVEGVRCYTLASNMQASLSTLLTSMD